MASIQNVVQGVINTGKAALSGDFSGLKEGGKRALQATLMQSLSAAIPKFISARSALSDRPVGEWHLVVGNPMNPIMVMGDLICTKCEMTWDEEMGPDDFPTGITFKVTLQQGKPRDKVAIERMFNLGQSKMMRSKLRNPSSATDTQGATNNKAYSELKQAITSEDGINKIREELGYPKAGRPQNNQAGLAISDNSFINYRNRVRRAYKYFSGNENDLASKSQPFDDGLLWLYFDRRLNNM
jgi:hypothetical protein